MAILITTSVGKFEFVCVHERIYSPVRDEVVVPLEQALFDCVYLLRRRRIDPQALFTFRNLEKLNPSLIGELQHRYPKTVAADVRDILRRR